MSSKLKTEWAPLAAGIDGIANKIEPGDPVNENIYSMSELRKKEHGIKPLPSNLQEGLADLRSDYEYLLQSCFSNELLQSYLELKEHEFRIGSGKGRPGTSGSIMMFDLNSTNKCYTIQGNTKSESYEE
jgi:hypothetical protein